MQDIRSILVYLETADDQDMALTRAKLIAGVTGANLHLLLCDRDSDHSHQLNLLQDALRQEGYSVTGEQAWRGNVHDTIIYVQQVFGCELLIKHHVPESALKNALLTPLDWKLLRDCPSAVLMVKTSRSWKQGVVLAAVDVGNNDAGHRQLHAKIIDHGYDISRLARGELHVIAAYPSPIVSGADPAFQSAENLESHYREQCRAFQAEFDVDDQHLHVAEGPADVLIPFTAQKFDAVVTVIGTVARRGISGAFIGNTAEAVLDSLESDVLVLKTNEIIDYLSEMSGN